MLSKMWRETILITVGEEDSDIGGHYFESVWCSKEEHCAKYRKIMFYTTAFLFLLKILTCVGLFYTPHR